VKKKQKYDAGDAQNYEYLTISVKPSVGKRIPIISFIVVVIHIF
jgi:hypothetical protein